MPFWIELGKDDEQLISKARVLLLRDCILSVHVCPVPSTGQFRQHKFASFGLLQSGLCSCTCINQWFLSSGGPPGPRPGKHHRTERSPRDHRRRLQGPPRGSKRAWAPSARSHLARCKGSKDTGGPGGSRAERSITSRRLRIGGRKNPYSLYRRRTFLRVNT